MRLPPNGTECAFAFVALCGQLMKPVRVLLADDHKLVRAGFRSMLETLGYVDIVGETGDGREALELIRKHRPDVALLDITMPSLTGLEVARRVADEIDTVR